MKLLFDNNLSVKLPEVMIQYFPESKHVSGLDIGHYTDRQIFDFAAKNQFTIVSKDKDFYHILNTLGPPPKVVWLSVGNCSNEKVISIMLKNEKPIAEFIKSSRSLFVISSK